MSDPKIDKLRAIMENFKKTDEELRAMPTSELLARFIIIIGDIGAVNTKTFVDDIGAFTEEEDSFIIETIEAQKENLRQVSAEIDRRFQ